MPELGGRGEYSRRRGPHSDDVSRLFRSPLLAKLLLSDYLGKSASGCLCRSRGQVLGRSGSLPEDQGLPSYAPRGRL